MNRKGFASILVVILVVLALALIGGVLYFYFNLSPLNNDVDMGLQKIEQSPISLATSTIPSDWQTYKGDGWTIAYPSQFRLTQLPAVSTGRQPFVFTSSDKTMGVNLDVNTIDLILTKNLIINLQQVAHSKGYEISHLDAVLLLEQEGYSSWPANERPAIVVERRITLNGMPGIQFATRDPGTTSIFLTTSFEGGGKIIDISAYVKSFDESDPTMKIYAQMMSSFQFTN